MFLKISRLIKRRTRAREMCDGKRVLVNGREAKPGKEIKPGDILTLKFSSRSIELEILDTPASSTKKTIAEELYRVRSETRLQENED